MRVVVWFYCFSDIMYRTVTYKRIVFHCYSHQHCPFKGSSVHQSKNQTKDPHTVLIYPSSFDWAAFPSNRALQTSQSGRQIISQRGGSKTSEGGREVLTATQTCRIPYSMPKDNTWFIYCSETVLMAAKPVTSNHNNNTFFSLFISYFEHNTKYLIQLLHIAKTNAV